MGRFLQGALYRLMQTLAKHPIGRFGRVEEVADACNFSCAGEAGVLTGANISIDGGYGQGVT